MDWYAVTSFGGYPASDSTSLERASYAVSCGLYAGTEESLIPSITIQTFPWDDIGPCTGLEVYDRDYVFVDDFPGWEATRPAVTRDKKGFKISWERMTVTEWLYLIEFWRDVKTAMAFYWEFPIEMYGVGGFGGDADQEKLGGWPAAEGWGEGPLFLVRFMDSPINQKFIHPHYWEVSATIEEV